MELPVIEPGPLSRESSALTTRHDSSPLPINHLKVCLPIFSLKFISFCFQCFPVQLRQRAGEPVQRHHRAREPPRGSRIQTFDVR